MAKKFKKQTTSTSFSLSQLFRRISTMQPSTFALTVVIMGAALFLFGGGVWSVINYATIQPAVYYNNAFYFIAPGLGEQFIFDTVVAASLYAMGFIGLLAIYQSTKYAYKPRQAYMTLVIGVTLLLLAYLFLENIALWKASF
jgi:NO-binding membrane sensor protein with MHYT domain